ncbi:uncharacterized protein LOC130764100 [Actinidia eriantha]|uniref:uncharacterized protein LOC130764100 n=1 Tax=Actinidia eriantha TaxID=165200 RepID=UPI002590AFBE|nr:uncharacterized protein LOC130764100 [Actinidia eriantha]
MAAGGRIWGLFVYLATFLLLWCGANADGMIKQVSDPTGNLNLSPFDKYRSIYECMLNTSTSCADKYQLTEEGWLNVTRVDTESYCIGGCAKHTQAVLMCIHLVKQDYKFISKASVQDLNETINLGCENGFTGFTTISSATKNFERKSALFLSAVPAFLLVTYFIM